MVEITEGKVSEMHEEFRKGKYCVAYVFTINIMVE